MLRRIINIVRREGRVRGRAGILFLGNCQGSHLEQVTSEPLPKGSEIKGQTAPFPAVSSVTGSQQ